MKVKKILLTVLVFTSINILVFTSASAQIIAGSGFAGLIVSNPNVNLAESTIGNTTTAFFDLTCDSIADMRVELYKGPTAIDGANLALLHILNPLFQICADTGFTSFSPVTYYNNGDTLICPGSSHWSTDSIFKLGDFGCMDCQGPYSVSNLFIAYRNSSTSQKGWIKISFDLTDGGGATPITLSLPEILSPCVSTALAFPATGNGTDTCGIFTFTSTVLSPSCGGNCDGAIAITSVSGGTPEYTYFWTPSGIAGTTLNNLCAGVYILNITDSVGHTCTSVFTITNPESPSYSLIVTDASCNGFCDGTICCTGVSGGTPAYTYLWNDPSASTTPCLISACAGNYFLIITDANGCTTIIPAVVNEPPLIQITEVISDVSCSTCCDGNFQLNLIGGTAPYSISYSGGYSPPQGDLCQGIYNYCVTDESGCSTCDSVLVSFPLSIRNNEPINSFAIYPNPNNGEFAIEFDVAEKENSFIEIKNVLGQTVKTINNNVFVKGINKTEIDVREFSSGLYFVQLQYGNRIIREKIIKE